MANDKINNGIRAQDKNEYQQTYLKSITENTEFWTDRAKTLHWDVPFTQTRDVSFEKDDLRIKWFADGELNVCVNCVDRHLENNADRTAIIWEGNEPENSRHISYQELHSEVCKLSNSLESLGMNAGDRVILYMPMIPEAAYAMLACARLGLVHSIVFGGFLPKP